MKAHEKTNEQLIRELKDLRKQLADPIKAKNRRKGKEETIAQLRRQNDLILNSAGEGIYGLDRNGLTTFVNPAAVRMLGWLPEELNGKPQHAVIHHTRPDGKPYPREECPIYAAFKDGKVHLVNNEVFWRKDGTSFPVEYTSTPIRDERDGLEGAVVTFRDITKRKKAEEEIESLARFPSENPNPVLRITNEGTIIYANEGSFPLLKAWGCQKSRHLPDTWCNCVSDVFNSGKSQEIEMTCGNQIFLVLFSPVVEAGYVCVYGRDITERKQAEEAIRRANEDLEQKVELRTLELREKQAQLVQSEKMASLGQLVAGVAHEINTPLGALRSNIDIFMRSVEKVKALFPDVKMPQQVDKLSELDRLLQNIEQLNSVNKTAVERILAIVNTLRNFARLDMADLDLADIHEGLENTLTLAHHELNSRIEIHKDYGNIPPIKCYPNQLNQVFMNHLVNASHAIKGPGKIFIKTRISNGSIMIEIRDTGIGITDEDLSHIFDPGFTTKGVGVGTGLGLSIVYQIIEKHKGKIEVESEPGKGTTFRLILPMDLDKLIGKEPGYKDK